MIYFFVMFLTVNKLNVYKFVFILQYNLYNIS